MALTMAQIEILRSLIIAWPDPLTIAPETPDLLRLRDEDMISEYDSWPDGRRRWLITPAGKLAIYPDA